MNSTISQLICKTNNFFCTSFRCLHARKCFSIWFPRLPAGQRVSDETQRALSATSVLRPHPPPPLSHTKHRPPSGALPSKTSVKLVNSSSLSRTHGQHRSTSASTGPRETQTPICNRITTSGPGTDQIMVKTAHLSLSAKQDSTGRRAQTSSPSFQIKTPGNSPIHAAHLSSHRRVHSPSRKCDVSPQAERKSSPAWRSRNINSITSPVPVRSLHCDTGSYSSNSANHSVSTAGKSKTQNRRQNNTCGGVLLSTTVQTHNDRRKSTSESSHSCVGSRKSNSGIDRNKNGHLGKDVTQQPSSHCLTDRPSHHPESSETHPCIHPASVQINGQFFTSPRRPLEGTTSQPIAVQDAQTELEFIKFHQPVPPARVLTWSQPIISQLCLVHTAWIKLNFNSLKIEWLYNFVLKCLIEKCVLLRRYSKCCSPAFIEKYK